MGFAWRGQRERATAAGGETAATRFGRRAAEPTALFGAALCLGLLSAAPAAAQTPFADLEFDRSQEIDVAADALEVVETENKAVFTGDVDVTQGPMRLRADALEVFYQQGGSGGGAGAIARIVAAGGVIMTNGEANARAERVDYAVDAGRVVLSGRVVIVKDESAISGSRLTIDLNRGTAFMAGRVRARAGR